MPSKKLEPSDTKGRIINAEQAFEWITALAAAHIIAPTFGSDDSAKLIIISRLVDGMLEGRADIVIQEADIGKLDFGDLWRPPFAYPGQIEDRYVDSAASADAASLVVPADFFLAGKNGWVLDSEMTFWPEGRFVARSPASFRAPLKREVIAERRGSPPVPTKIPQSGAIRRGVLGLRFRRSDIEAIAGRPYVSEPVAIFTRGKLPASAKPNHRKHEEAAHSAAEIIRNEKILPEQAFRLVAPKDSTRDDNSITRAVRRCFDLMYDRNGLPHPY